MLEVRYMLLKRSRDSANAAAEFIIAPTREFPRHAYAADRIDFAYTCLQVL